MGIRGRLASGSGGHQPAEVRRNRTLTNSPMLQRPSSRPTPERLTPLKGRPGNVVPCTSRSTNAARSSGERDSSTTSSVSETSSAISAVRPGSASASVETGSGSQSPMYSSRRRSQERTMFSAARVTALSRYARGARTVEGSTSCQRSQVS